MNISINPIHCMKLNNNSGFDNRSWKQQKALILMLWSLNPSLSFSKLGSLEEAVFHVLKWNVSRLVAAWIDWRAKQMQKINKSSFTKIFNICWCVVWTCAVAMRLHISNKRGIVGADLNICISMCLKGPNSTASLFTTFLTEIEFIQNPTHLIYFYHIPQWVHSLVS